MIDRSPLITLGLTTYNAADTVERAVHGILAQNWQATEVIVVDDASTDQTQKNLDRLKEKYINLRVIKLATNHGVSHARNQIIAEAKGDYIGFFDDDDFSHPERINVQFGLLRQLGEFQARALCFARSRKIYSNGHVVDLGHLDAVQTSADDFLRHIFIGSKAAIKFSGGTPAATLFASRAILQELNGFDESFRRVEDIDLALRATLAGAKLVGTKDCLVDRFHTEATDKSAATNYSAEQKLLAKFKEHLEEASILSASQKWFKVRLYYFQRQYGRLAFAVGAFAVRHPVWFFKKALSTVPKRLAHEIRQQRRSK